MSKNMGIDIINDHEFKIKWWDLNHEAQKRLLNTIFRTKPIATVEFDYDPVTGKSKDDDEEDIKEEK